MAARSLESVSAVAARRPLKVGEALGVLRDAAEALAELHATGRVHGAVCADNIVLDEQGAARLCHDTPAPPAVSPEQRAGSLGDVRSDVWGLGATVAGLLADAGKLPEPLGRLLAKMTAQQPFERYQSMTEVLMALEACELMTGYRGFRPGQEARAMQARRRLLYVVVLALSALMFVLALFVALGPTPKARGKPPASYKDLLDRMAPLPARPRPTTNR